MCVGSVGLTCSVYDYLFILFVFYEGEADQNYGNVSFMQTETIEVNIEIRKKLFHAEIIKNFDVI